MQTASEERLVRRMVPAGQSVIDEADRQSERPFTFEAREVGTSASELSAWSLFSRFPADLRRIGPGRDLRAPLLNSPDKVNTDVHVYYCFFSYVVHRARSGEN
jgi:hypothetical protein